MRELGQYRSSVLDTGAQRDEALNIVLLGEGSVGKTTLTIRVKEGRFVEYYDPTLYDVHKFKLNVDQEDLTIEIQDTAGQDVFYDTVMDEFIRKAQGVVFMYQVTSRASLREVEEKFIAKVRLLKKEKFSGVLIGNKIDLETFREVATAEGKALADKYKLPFYELSLKSDDKGIAKGIVEDLLRKIRPVPLPPKPKAFVPQKKDQESQKWCDRTCGIF